MTIIKITPEWNGSHNSIENADNILPGWAEIPESCMDIWKASGPFVNLELNEDGEIINMVNGTEIGPDMGMIVPDKLDELNAAAQTAMPEPDPIETALCELDATYDERMTAIENALCELDGGANNG